MQNTQQVIERIMEGRKKQVEHVLNSKTRGMDRLTFYAEQTPDEARELVGFYHKGLLEGGLKDYSLEDCIKDYEYGLIITIRYIMAILGSLEIDNDENAKALGLIWLTKK